MRVRRLTATLALSALVLSGCSGEGDGEETTSSTVKPTVIDPSGDSSSTSGSSSSSTSGSSTRSTSEANADGPPQEAKANTKEGAEAFAKWYYEQVGEALTSNDSAIVRRFSTGNCKPCRALAKRIDENRSKKRHVDSNPYRIDKVSSISDPHVRVVSLEVTELDHNYVNEDGTTQAVSVSEPKYTIVVNALWENDAWVVDQMAMVLK